MTDNQPQELSREGQVSHLNGSLRLCYPFGTLSINRKVQGHPPLCGISQQWLTQKLANFDNFPLVVKIGGERGPVGINILVV